MINCDVFILISILIVVLLLIYNRNKRDKQIEGFAEPHPMNEIKAESRRQIVGLLGAGINDKWTTNGVPPSLSSNDWDGKNRAGTYYSLIDYKNKKEDVQERIKELARSEIGDFRPYNKIKAESRRQIVGLLGAGINDKWTKDGTPPYVVPNDWDGKNSAGTHYSLIDYKQKKEDVQERIKELARQAVSVSNLDGNAGPKISINSEVAKAAETRIISTLSPTHPASLNQNPLKKHIVELIREHPPGTSGGGASSIRDLAREEFDKKFSKLQGATIKLNKNNIQCFKKNGYKTDCPDSIVQSG
jgi:hypothetical protein